MGKEAKRESGYPECNRRTERSGGLRGGVIDAGDRGI